jgi:O-antigen ligase
MRGRRVFHPGLLLACVGLAVFFGYASATYSPALAIALVGAPIWCLLAYRYPLVGIAVLSSGQFFLRVVLAGVTDLGRSTVSLSGILVGALVLGPLLAAALAPGNLRMLRLAARSQPLVLSAVALISVAVVLSYLSAPSSYGLIKLIAYVGLNLPLLLLPVLLVRTPQDARQLMLAMIVVSALTLASSLIGTSSVWEATALRTRAGGATLANEQVDIGTWFARRVAIGGLAAVSVLLLTQYRRYMLVAACAAALFSGVVLAASRSPVLGLAIALFAMLILSGRAVRRSGARLAIVLVVFVGSLVAAAQLPPRFAQRYEESLSFENEGLQRRIGAWELSLELIEREPLTGVGLGHYSDALYGVDRIIYPHSLVLEFAAELGIPVALLLLLMVGGGIQAGWRALRWSNDEWIRALALWAIGIQVLAFIGAQSSGDLRTNEHVWLAVGGGIAAWTVARRAQPQSVTRAGLPRPAEQALSAESPKR